MLRYALRRLAVAVPTLLVIITLSFALERLAPGGPFDQEQTLTPAVRANLDRLYGLDRPLPVQFGRYLAALAHGDFGPSLSQRDFGLLDTGEIFLSTNPGTQIEVAGYPWGTITSAPGKRESTSYGPVKSSCVKRG